MNKCPAQPWPCPVLAWGWSVGGLRCVFLCHPRAGSRSQPSTTSPLLRSTRPSWWTLRRYARTGGPAWVGGWALGLTDLPHTLSTWLRAKVRGLLLQPVSPGLPRPSPTMSSPQTTTRARSPTGTIPHLPAPPRPPWPWACPLTTHFPQLCQQVSAEGGRLRSAAGAVSEGHRHL